MRQPFYGLQGADEFWESTVPEKAFIRRTMRIKHLSPALSELWLSVHEVYRCISEICIIANYITKFSTVSVKETFAPRQAYFSQGIRIELVMGSQHATVHAS